MASLLAGADTMVRLPFSPSVSSLMGGVMHRGVQGSLSLGMVALSMWCFTSTCPILLRTPELMLSSR